MSSRRRPSWTVQAHAGGEQSPPHIFLDALRSAREKTRRTHRSPVQEVIGFMVGVIGVVTQRWRFAPPTNLLALKIHLGPPEQAFIESLAGHLGVAKDRTGTEVVSRLINLSDVAFAIWPAPERKFGVAIGVIKGMTWMLEAVNDGEELELREAVIGREIISPYRHSHSMS